jgi:ArsR family transcriptional regulator, arsenate/arsenite/antimonite-responsive transcriptional repressor
MYFIDDLRYDSAMAATTSSPPSSPGSSSVSSAAVRPVVCCAPLCADILGDADAESLAGAFTALADPVRLRLLSCVASAEEVCACDLLEPSGRSQPTVSHHMKILVEAGLVTREKRGLWVWYKVDRDRLAQLRSVLG